jgi:hypothetical protein
LAGPASNACRYPGAAFGHAFPAYHGKLPYLMLVGRYDSILGHEAAAKPLFDLIGTPDEHKVMKVYETDHIPSKSDYIAEILAWLDVYLGPVG